MGWRGNWNLPVDSWPAGTGSKAQARCRQDGNWGILLMRPKGTKAFPSENIPEMKGICRIVTGWSESVLLGLSASHWHDPRGLIQLLSQPQLHRAVTRWGSPTALSAADFEVSLTSVDKELYHEYLKSLLLSLAKAQLWLWASTEPTSSEEMKEAPGTVCKELKLFFFHGHVPRAAAAPGLQISRRNLVPKPLSPNQNDTNQAPGNNPGWDSKHQNSL